MYVFTVIWVPHYLIMIAKDLAKPVPGKKCYYWKNYVIPRVTIKTRSVSQNNG